jgi:hypothetical protein
MGCVVRAVGRPQYSLVKHPARLQLPYHTLRFRGNAAGKYALDMAGYAPSRNQQGERESRVTAERVIGGKLD